MAVARKPKPQPAAQDVDIDALINRGGSVAGNAPVSRESSEPVPMQVNLRFPPALLHRIDEALRARPIKTPRQTWILEAVLEKLKRESAE